MVTKNYCIINGNEYYDFAWSYYKERNKIISIMNGYGHQQKVVFLGSLNDIKLKTSVINLSYDIEKFNLHL